MVEKRSVLVKYWTSIDTVLDKKYCPRIEVYWSKMEVYWTCIAIVLLKSYCPEMVVDCPCVVTVLPKKYVCMYE